MCGRFSATSVNQIPKSFPYLRFAEEVDVRYNVAPTQRVAIAKADGSDTITAANWGLVPKWAKSLEALKIRPINAKLETVAENRMFAPLLKRQRCLIFADGFFEWRKDGAKKTPIYFTLKSGEPFAFAGLWDQWHDDLTTCTLLTGPPNQLVAPIHDRMPMMLNEKTGLTWIDQDAPVDMVLSMLGPYPVDEMKSWAVSDQMNKPSFDKPEALEPVS